MNQKWFHSWSVVEGNMAIFSKTDLEIVKQLSGAPSLGQETVTQQGKFESFYRDLIVGFGKWEFDPTQVSNPCPENKGNVHIWQGYEDKIIPRKLNQYIVEKLGWIKYHKVPDAGHFFIYNATLYETILRELVNG
ncbi:uncharacterized protein LOC107855113 [Capsicum annuum]|uniref:uncharacterized protein LOC107855113 n=1 Tax=Capsicum annuum TaxID=4072 RepID=UPI001FB07C0F|nr:uncharacterized protein LOC107855113 [Capsicum annuum]